MFARISPAWNQFWAKVLTGWTICIATKAKQGSVLIFSLEMGKEQLVDRLLAAEAGVDAWRLRTGEGLTDNDFERLSAAMGNWPKRRFLSTTVQVLRLAICAPKPGVCTTSIR